MRRKTSIYVDGDLWERFKKHAVARGVEVSSLLEELMREELGDYVDEALGVLAGSDSYELDFEPVEPKGPVSQCVREMRDERERGLLGQ
uniref:CopG family transcriptional regulator n=1 Tax=Thermofilum adornatum TaxID=1365176 RepID=A0A7C1CGC9_9CREN